MVRFEETFLADKEAGKYIRVQLLVVDCSENACVVYEGIKKMT